MARVTLFDQASISPYSRFFWLEKQVTVVGHGLQPDDYITFEVVETNAAPMAKNCGCDFVPAGAISLNSILELTCSACNGVVSPVVLTAANPVVVLDHPQGFYLRAVYHGTGLATGEVIVRATDTETRDLTDALRGCPERCPDYVGTLCITPGTRAFGVNDPRDPEATVPIMREGDIVGYIYPTPRSHAPVPVTEDPCQPCDGNTVGAIIGYAMPWDGPETECLCLCYECQDVSWEQVGDAFCRNDTLWVNEISNCGRTRERDTGDACCVDTTWTQVGDPECRDDDFWWVVEESNCGNTRERNTGVPCDDEPCVPNWTNVGSPYCQGDDCVQLQQDGCGNTRTVASTGCSPACGTCTPNYVATSTYECGADERYYRWFTDVNNCGGANGEWRYVGPVTWTDNGEQICDGSTNTWHQPEVNQCGGTRIRDTGIPCEEPCVPGDWEDVPDAFQCVGNQTQKQQFNGCEYRWVDTGHVWEDDSPAVTRCEEIEGVCQYQKRQHSIYCPGVRRYVTIEPCSWTPTGEEQCEDGFIQVRETNQCGNTRWRVTETPCGEPEADLSWFPPFAGCCTRRGAGIGDDVSLTISLNPNGTGSARTNCSFPITGSGSWLPAGESAGDYEARLTNTAGPNPVIPTGSGIGVWVNLSSGAYWNWTVVAPGPGQGAGGVVRGRVDVRRVGTTDTVTTGDFEIDIRVHEECE